LDESLKRLNMSYVDILYVHAYEYRTPIEEFMRSLDDVVRSGKVNELLTYLVFFINIIKKKK
jgi:aryl-alcohol dehydrogenase-like predicted oxidoreductase